MNDQNLCLWNNLSSFGPWCEITRCYFQFYISDKDPVHWHLKATVGMQILSFSGQIISGCVCDYNAFICADADNFYLFLITHMTNQLCLSKSSKHMNFLKELMMLKRGVVQVFQSVVWHWYYQFNEHRMHGKTVGNMPEPTIPWECLI